MSDYIVVGNIWERGIKEEFVNELIEEVEKIKEESGDLWENAEEVGRKTLELLFDYFGIE